MPPLIPRGSLKVMYAGPVSKHHEEQGGYTADFASPSLSALGGARI